MPENTDVRKRTRVTVRLYRRHDLDLIALYLTDGFKFQREMAACARAAAEGERYEVHMPDGGASPRKGYVRRHYTLSLSFGRAGDEAAVSLLAGIKPGMRCPYLKALMRSCIKNPSGSLPVYEEGNGIYISEDAARTAGEQIEPETVSRVQPVHTERNTGSILPFKETVKKQQDNDMETERSRMPVMGNHDSEREGNRDDDMDMSPLQETQQNIFPASNTDMEENDADMDAFMKKFGELS